MVRLELELTLDRDLTGRGETGGFETGHRAYSTDAVTRELQVVHAQHLTGGAQP